MSKLREFENFTYNFLIIQISFYEFTFNLGNFERFDIYLSNYFTCNFNFFKLFKSSSNY